MFNFGSITHIFVSFSDSLVFLATFDCSWARFLPWCEIQISLLDRMYGIYLSGLSLWRDELRNIADSTFRQFFWKIITFYLSYSLYLSVFRYVLRRSLPCIKDCLDLSLSDMCLYQSRRPVMSSLHERMMSS